MAKGMQALTTQAVLKSFEVGIEPAAEIFDLDPEDLLNYRNRFLLSEYEKAFAAKQQAEQQRAESGLQPILLRLRQNPLFDFGLKVILAVLLIALCWAMPSVLQPYVDPLTNTVVWIGFTALYLTVFFGMGIELVFWVQHHVNFDFLNPFSGDGQFDYATLIRSDQLSAYERCRLNQQKYLAYLFAFCLISMGLASLTNGGS